LSNSFHLAISSIGLASAGMPTVRLERDGVLIRFAATTKVRRVTGHLIERAPAVTAL
jgi:hypothetical protein